MSEKQEATVRAAFARAGTILDGPGMIEAELDEIAEKSSGSWAQLAENGWDGEVPLTALSHLLTVTTALREVLGLPASRTSREVREHGPWTPSAAVDAPDGCVARETDPAYRVEFPSHFARSMAEFVRDLRLLKASGHVVEVTAGWAIVMSSSALAVLAGLPAHADGSVHDNQLWIGGRGHAVIEVSTS